MYFKQTDLHFSMILEKCRLVRRHTVHPSCPDTWKSRLAPPLKIARDSWCTPELTRQHDKLSKSNSIKETKSIERTDRRMEIGSVFNAQKIRLVASSPPPSYKEVEPPTELQPIEKIESAEGNKKSEPPIKKDTAGHSIESPQSPVPSSPSRSSPCQDLFKLPSFCDPFIPIDPQGRVYIAWLFLVTSCYCYNAWGIALRATFPYQTAENTPYWMMIDYFCDVIYLLDGALVKPRLMFLNEGFWVDDVKETRKNYRKKLQYKFDLISLLPLDILYIYFGTQRVILRFPRMLKLQTFWECHQAVDRVLSSPYVVRIGKTLLYIFYLIHLNACAYYAMSDYIGLGSNGWVYDNKGCAYLRCFYFATKTATSIGKNPKPEKTEEYLFMTAAWLMGVFVFALLIGQIRDIIATATRATTEYRKTVDGCTTYLRKLNMPLTIQRRVTSYFSYTWSQQRCFDESKILNSLPINMKRDVALEVHISTLSKVQLFRDCSSSLLRDLVLQLRPVTSLPGDVVVRRGEVGYNMYIIKSGECYVMAQNEKEILATLREGSVFGEISLLGIDGLRRRTATVRSRGYTNLFALSRADLDAALKHHKEAAQILRIRADQIIRENAARQAKQKIMEQQARKEEVRREEERKRMSSVSSNESNLNVEGRRLRSASGQSRQSRRRRLSAVSENKVHCGTSQASIPSMRTPLPTIILSSD